MERNVALSFDPLRLPWLLDCKFCTRAGSWMNVSVCTFGVEHFHMSGTWPNVAWHCRHAASAGASCSRLQRRLRFPPFLSPSERQRGIWRTPRIASQCPQNCTAPDVWMKADLTLSAQHTSCRQTESFLLSDLLCSFDEVSPHRFNL